MKLTIKKDRRTNLEKEIDEELSKLMKEIRDQEVKTAGLNEEERNKKLSEAKRQKMSDLDKMLEIAEKRQKLDSAKWKFSPDTLLVVGGNLLGIGLILSHEKLNVISSKALGFVLRGRV